MALPLEEAHVSFKDDEPVAFLSRKFLQYAELDEVVDQGSRRVGLRLNQRGGI